MDLKEKDPEGKLVAIKRPAKTSIYLFDVLILVAMAIALYYGAFWKSPSGYDSSAKLFDVARYECYAVVFWRGTSGLQTLPKDQCAFLSPSSPYPFHTLPKEYPLLVLIPFSFALLIPLPSYQLSFALLMALIAIGVYFLLSHVKGREAALAFIAYLVVGCWATAEGRFDLVPSALTLLALLCAERTCWNWAFALLALATLFKFYPLVLLPAFLVAQQMQYEGTGVPWRRAVPLAIFVVVCVIGVSLSFLLSIEGTLAPLSYFAFRPIQIESPSASVVWLASELGHYQLSYTFSFGSRNVFSPLSAIVGQVGTVLLVVGIVYILWLQWRGKISLPIALILVLLLVMTTGKIFSPQYIIWVSPFIAYVGRGNWKWLASWGGIGILTTLIYPFLYEPSSFSFIPFLPPLYPTIFVRNVLLVGFTLVLLYKMSKVQQSKLSSDS